MSSSFLTFRSCVLPPLIFRVAFSFFASIIISTEFSSLEMLMVVSALDLWISAFSAHSKPTSSSRNFRSFPSSFPGILSQLNKYRNFIFLSKISFASSKSHGRLILIHIPSHSKPCTRFICTLVKSLIAFGISYSTLSAFRILRIASNIFLLKI